jgi:hypothetical protein
MGGNRKEYLEIILFKTEEVTGPVRIFWDTK